MELPKFTGHAGLAEPLDPPYRFTDVTVSAFPLRASVERLQRFCDAYLNVAPREIAHFRASMPFVFLLMLDYGKMSADARNFGYLAQREILFGVPLEWYRWERGRWVFHDWASVSPFIYVDEEMSRTFGRTSLGWPKSQVRLMPDLSGWMTAPDGSTVDVAVSARVFPRSYEGAALRDEMVLRVSSPMSTTLRMPPDPNDRLMPWSLWSDLASLWADTANDGFGWLRALGAWMPDEGSSSDNWLRKLERAGQIARGGPPWAPNFVVNGINLKQFRRADAPQCYCYQALTHGPLRHTSVMRTGLLGQPRGDLSGGYEIDLASWPNFPIADTLGLQGQVVSMRDSPSITRLRPVLPFWYVVDMELERTRTLAWRGQDGEWHDGEGKPFAWNGAPDLHYNTARGAASPVIAGPYAYDHAELRVFPLLAHTAQLSETLDRMLNAAFEDRRVRFEVWRKPDASCAYVYAVAGDWGEVTSLTNSIGNWANMSLTFYIPVKRIDTADDGVQQTSFGLVPVYAFSGDFIQTCTMSELYGVPSVDATFHKPGSAWDCARASAGRCLLEVSAESLPSLYEGQMLRKQTVVRILEQPRAAGADDSVWAQRLRELREQERGAGVAERDARAAGRALGLRLLACAEPLFVHTLKQFPQAERSERACYQALIRIPYALEELQSLRPLGAELALEFHEAPMLPMAKTLGLVSEAVGSERGTRTIRVRPFAPFALVGKLSLRDAFEDCVRTGLVWKYARQHVPVSQAAAPAVVCDPQTIVEALFEQERADVAPMPAQGASR